MSKRISIIIPAYNEGPRIGTVLKTLKSLPEQWEKIVVSDGSNDDTVLVAKSFEGVKVLELPKNAGKAAAMYTGFKSSSGDYIVFIDADLLGLKVEHLRDLLAPVQRGDSDMSMASLRDPENVQVTLSHICFPHLSGQRAAKREIWKKIFDSIQDINSLRYGIEKKIKKISDCEKWNIEIIKWKGVSQVMKEQKIGFKKGVVSRLKMYKEMIRK